MSGPMADLLLHRHGSRVHRHPHRGRHRHLGLALRASRPVETHDPPRGGHGFPPHHERGHDRAVEHRHSHGLVDDSVKRSSEGVQAVIRSLVVLGATAAVQAGVFVASGSVALLADLIHNAGDALTALPLGVAFALRSTKWERRAGVVVVAAIGLSACVAGVEAVRRLLHPMTPDHLAVLTMAGGVGFVGNCLAARIRTRAGQRLASPALIADGRHARADAYVSLSVVASAAVVAIGLPIADPLIGLAITAVILRITWQSWRTMRTPRHG